ncbi:hypothetical protein Tco_0256020 [Tanacetum coccineum]
MLNSDPSSTLPLEEQKFKELKIVEPSSDELPELELKYLPLHLEYAFLEGTNKLLVIIAKDLKDEDKTALLKVLRSHKCAIAWKISNIKGIDPKFCTHKILMEDNVKPMGTDISQKDEKPSKKRQNRTRDGKVCEGEAQSKSSQLREEKAKKNKA